MCLLSHASSCFAYFFAFGLGLRSALSRQCLARLRDGSAHALLRFRFRRMRRQRVRAAAT